MQVSNGQALPASEPISSLEAHPAATIFPMLSGDAYSRFATDIQNNGLLQSIVLCDGRILDGRNRYRVCIERGVTPHFRQYSGECHGSPTAFVWAMNGERRQLSHAQKTAAAVEMLPALEAEAKLRQQVTQRRGNLPVPPCVEGPAGEAAAVAAHLVGVSRSSVHQARAVKAADPVLFEQLRNNRIKVSKAHERVRSATSKRAQEPAGKQPRAQRIEAIKELLSEGYRPEQIAQRLQIGVEHLRVLAHAAGLKFPTHKQATHKLSRIVEQTITVLEGCAVGVRVVTDDSIDVSKEDAFSWAEAMGSPLRELLSFHRLLQRLSR